MNRRDIILLTLVPLLSFTLVVGENKLQDPTKPPAFAVPETGKKKLAELKLSEIRITAADRQAVINGKRLRKGSSIANYRLKKIAVGYVILANEKGTMRLNLISNRIIRKKL